MIHSRKKLSNEEVNASVRRVIPLPDKEIVKEYYHCTLVKKNSLNGTMYISRKFVIFIAKKKFLKEDIFKIIRSSEIRDIRNYEQQLKIVTKDKVYLFRNFEDEETDVAEKSIKRLAFGIPGNTQLHIAVKKSLYDKVRDIIEKDPTGLLQYNLREQVPLHLAIMQNDTDMVDLILGYYQANNFDINEQDKKNHNTTLHVACSNRDIPNNLLLSLLQYPGIDVNAQNEDDNTPLHYFCGKTQSLNCDKLGDILVEAGSDVNLVNRAGETPLHKAILNRSVRLILVDMLIKHNVDVNHKNNEVESPLHYATRLGRTDLVERLISAGADIHAPNRDGLSPVQLGEILYNENTNPSLRRNIREMKALYDNVLALYSALSDVEMTQYLAAFVSEHLHTPEEIVNLDSERLSLLPLPLDQTQLEAFLDVIEPYKEQILSKEENSENLEQKSLFQQIINPSAKTLVSEKMKLDIDVSGLRKEVDLTKDLEIAFEDIEFVERIGKGTSGEVFKGIYKNNQVAVKVLNQINIEKEMNDFKEELQVLMKVESPYVITLMGATLDPQLCIVMEYCSKGNLYELINSIPNLPWHVVIRFLRDICLGVDSLHKVGVVHRDLKTLNLLVSAEYRIKVCDFGLSRVMNDDLDTFTKLVGTYVYLAPEVYEGDMFTFKSDVYSIGIVSWEMINASVNNKYSEPYSEFSIGNGVAVLAQTSQGLRPNIPKGTPMFLVAHYLSCVDPDPEKRPTCEELASNLLGLAEIMEIDPEIFEYNTYQGGKKFTQFREGKKYKSHRRVRSSRDEVKKNQADSVRKKRSRTKSAYIPNIEEIYPIQRGKEIQIPSKSSK
eukprot:TRINITY_DN9310_c0_g1_i1.p1 TRINITY_DN9310_c0_g1~~TRINITY_DN9310_c0_g1_i1.p1  ORF type:complete len:835 (-),score=196.53 TRINITY_DN9310_c0_g1_i1:106-2610(-)